MTGPVQALAKRRRNLLTTRHKHFLKSTPRYEPWLTETLLRGKNALARVHSQSLKSPSCG